MNRSIRTAGATLVLTVLVVMLLLAAVVAVTGQLAVSARRSSADQQATLQAQYVAESGVARAQARLAQARTLLAGAGLDQAATTVSTLKTLFAQFCTVAETSVTDPSTAANSSTLCSATTAADGTNTSGEAIAFLLKTATYPAGWSAQTWTQLFSADGYSITGTVNGVSVTAAARLQAVRVVKQGTDDYLLKLRVLNVDSKGSTSTSRRSLSTSSPSEFALRLYRPPFSQFAQFRNQTKATAGQGGGPLYFSNGESFNGPVHTNATLRLSGNGGPGATFYDQLTTSTQSASNPGTPDIEYLDVSTACSTAATVQSGGCPAMYPNGSVSYPRYVPTIALPGNNNSQVRAAVGLPQVVDANGQPVAPTAAQLAAALGLSTAAPIAGGVYVSRATSPTVMTGGIYVKGDADIKLSTTGTPPQQVIQLTQGAAVTTLTQNAAGGWTMTKNNGTTTVLSGTFNGMLHVEGNVNMYGDGTDAADIAPTTALTVSNSGGDIKLKSSVTYSVNPLTTPNAVNVLGFFSSNGSVLLDGPINQDMNINASVLASATGKGFGSVRGSRGLVNNEKPRVNLIGGVIEEQSQTVSSGSNDGYRRNYAYDPRFRDGYSPPYFPLQQRWEADPDAHFDIGTVRQSP